MNGDIAKLKESYGRYIDHKAVRGADESRINSLQELAKGQQEHKDRLQEVAERQIVNQIQTLIAKGDLAGANKLMSENPNLLKTGALAKYFGERDQWGKEFGLKEKETNANVALMGTRNEAARLCFRNSKTRIPT
ncbi:hypothetical protein [Pelistega suis]|uniref:Uncharacterized protein n=1 Tax=Pelistega suis TaxID=1631957 RepID=A0A849P8P5_9BURK|nr:hypothetical protein [Pelistega suis]NOL52155.1 hypothetical protein [Pelistega suis]